MGPREGIRASEGEGRASGRGAGESAGPREGEGHVGETGVAWAAVWEGESVQGRGERVGEGRAHEEGGRRCTG